MNTLEQLDALQQRAARDENARKALLQSRKEPEPLAAFCRVCRQLGYELYPMEVIVAGEEFHAQMKRSTNGGGENSPMLDGQDDFYEMFLNVLEEQEKREEKEVSVIYTKKTCRYNEKK